MHGCSLSGPSSLIKYLFIQTFVISRVDHCNKKELEMKEEKTNRYMLDNHSSPVVLNLARWGMQSLSAGQIGLWGLALTPPSSTCWDWIPGAHHYPLLMGLGPRGPASPPSTSLLPGLGPRGMVPQTPCPCMRLGPWGSTVPSDPTFTGIASQWPSATHTQPLYIGIGPWDLAPKLLSSACWDGAPRLHVGPEIWWCHCSLKFPDPWGAH